MSPVRTSWARTIGMARNMFSTVFSVGAFLAVTSASFAFNLESIEKGGLPLVVVWAISVAPWLPVLSALLGMDVWSDERQTGRVDLLLSIAVRERDFALGKFLGVWTLVLVSLVLSFATVLVGLVVSLPAGLPEIMPGGVLSAFCILGVQGALWCALSVALSAFFCHAAASAGSAILLAAALPRGLWVGLRAWFPEGPAFFGEMPLAAHVVDFASGMISVGTLVSYVVMTLVMLFIASKAVALLRFVGRGAALLRVSTVSAMLLSLVFAGLSVMLCSRIRLVLDVPVSSSDTAFSARTRGILAESSGDVMVTCFLPRNDVRFRSVGHFLRALQRESISLGGARFDISFVDPRWDLGAAERLVRRGVVRDSLVFESGRRLAAVPIGDACDERVCAATIRRILTSPRRSGVYWTTGHGESTFGVYSAFGMSDIARELSREGYRHAALDLTADSQIPGDCALIVIAGAKDDFSRVEMNRLDAYLREGGRMLVLLGSARQGGVVNLLPSWGIRPEQRPLTGARTLSGTDVIVSDFADHAITSALGGSRIVLERPVSFSPSSAVETGSGADRIDFVSLASVGGVAVAAVAERGVGAGRDLALRPTRIVAIGDSTFVMNEELNARANANRDFLLNCVAYLAGTEVMGDESDRPEIRVGEMDRGERLRAAVVSTVVLPGVLSLILLLIVIRRRHRS